jgi:hypothetical protein
LDAALAWLGLAVISASWIAAPSICQGVHRVRSPAFAASAARLTQLPRWYVVPAALVGGVATDVGERVNAFTMAESRSGAAWHAVATTMLLYVAVRVPRWDAAAAIAAVVSAITLAGVIAVQRRLVEEP